MRKLHPRLRDGPQPREPEARGCLLLPGTSAVGQVGRVLRPGSCSVCYIFSVWSCFVLPQKAKFFPFFPAFLKAGLMWQNSLSQIFCFPTIACPFGGNGESQKLLSRTKWFSILLLVTLHPSAISEDQCRVGEGGGQAPLVTPQSPMWPGQGHSWASQSLSVNCRAHSVEGNTKMQSISHPMGLKSHLLSFRSQSQF